MNAASHNTRNLCSLVVVLPYLGQPLATSLKSESPFIRTRNNAFAFFMDSALGSTLAKKMSNATATPMRPRAFSHESYLVELSSQKINDKKHTDRLRNCLFINRVYELALEEEDTQRKQRQMRKRSVILSDATSKRLRVEDDISDDDSSDTTEEEDLNDLSDSDEPEDEEMSSPAAEPVDLRADAEDAGFMPASAAL